MITMLPRLLPETRISWFHNSEEKSNGPQNTLATIYPTPVFHVTVSTYEWDAVEW